MVSVGIREPPCSSKSPRPAPYNLYCLQNPEEHPEVPTRSTLMLSRRARFTGSPDPEVETSQWRQGRVSDAAVCIVRLFRRSEPTAASGIRPRNHPGLGWYE